MSRLGTTIVRLIPLLMQILGFAGVLYGGWYSAAMIIGTGIGSPNGVSSDVYVVAAWMVGIPAFVCLVGWIWMVCGFLAAPIRTNKLVNEDKDLEL
jgi:hypothetical protein